jgi:hypothetical protein
LHAKLSEWRQPFERKGWRRKPATLADLLLEIRDQSSGAQTYHEADHASVR